MDSTVTIGSNPGGLVPEVPPVERVIVYVDGFNLYQGMRSQKWRHCYWLDLAEFARRLLKPGQTLVAVRYFTAPVVGGSDKGRRQAIYLDAIATLTPVTVTLGRYQSEQLRCHKCHANWTVPKEKQTDVAVATAMTADACLGRCDTLLLVSGDSDLVPPIRLIRAEVPAVRVVVAFPPHRHARELQQAADGFMHVNRNTLEASQLPDEVTKANGHVLKRPEKWNL